MKLERNNRWKLKEMMEEVYSYKKSRGPIFHPIVFGLVDQGVYFHPPSGSEDGIVIDQIQRMGNSSLYVSESD